MLRSEFSSEKVRTDETDSAQSNCSYSCSYGCAFPLAQMATLIRTTDSAKLASQIETADTNSVVIKAAVEKHYDGDGWNFEPRTSDGVHITPQGDGMHLKGHPDEAFFVFENRSIGIHGRI